MRVSSLTIATLVASASAVQLPLSKFPDKNLWFAGVVFGVAPQTHFLLVDTGSPWTWTVTNNTVCYDPLVGGRTRCTRVFGTPYVPTSSLTRYNGSDDQVRLSYADLSVVRGTYAFEDFTFSGEFGVDQMPFVLATSTVMDSIWPGTGILGLSPDLPDEADFTASPDDVALRQIPSPRQDILLSAPRHHNKNAVTLASASSHDSVLTTIFNNNKNNSLPAYFGLAISRALDNSTWGGVLSIGETPDLSVSWINATSGPYVQVPLEPYHSSYTDKDIYVDYSTNISGVVFSRDASDELEGYYFADDREDTTFLFDSGTEVNFVPAIHAALIASRFQPPGYQQHGLWFVDCAATPPADIGIMVTESSAPFYINALDMVVYKEAQNRTTVCLSAFQGDYKARVLGTPFLKNVYVETYREDFVGEESATMWIASREHYQS